MWSAFSAEPAEFLQAGDEVVVLGRYRGTAKQTGKILDVPFVHIWSLRDGKAWRFRQFLDTAGWVEALSAAAETIVDGVDMSPTGVLHSRGAPRGTHSWGRERPTRATSSLVRRHNIVHTHQGGTSE